MYCKKCGTQLPQGTFVCPQCGTNNAQEDFVRTMIPHNSSALISYYTGLGSWLLLPLGIVAIIFGFKGIKYANENIEAKGKIHAWVGIICGFLTTLLLVFIIFAMIGSALSNN